ncbi:hypothetical protein [Arthrobacter woluwensis]|uniref:hypothetical protein n=1 Tax=Arthrobacter woluwensis TaxID=156980 RepID=UPI001AAF821F|nr:hypothetical protein [Arthrobacter woluwensis]QTF71948.1 hypothetical protein G8758_07990 [Arthrobacter woluwensis]
MNRVLAVSRMQLINKWTFLGIPSVILGGAFALCLALFAIIPAGPKFSGGAPFAPLWYFFALGIQSLTLTFPFSLGMSVTRRAFFLGTYVTFTAVALGMAVVYAIGTQVELATHGWGMDGYFFRVPFLFDGPWWQSLIVSFVITLFFFTLGFWGATLYKRWGVTGVLLVSIGLALLVVAAIFVITLGGLWGAVGDFLVRISILGLAGILALLAVAMGLGAFLTIRRAVP